MTLKEFIKTYDFNQSDIISYVDRDGEEIEINRSLLDTEVMNFHVDKGYLEIEMDI